MPFYPRKANGRKNGKRWRFMKKPVFLLLDTVIINFLY